MNIRLDVARHSTDPAALPDGTPDPLDVVFTYPAEDIVVAIEVTGSDDPVVLLDVLAEPVRAEVTP